jgi:hypothetical protein
MRPDDGVGGHGGSRMRGGELGLSATTMTTMTEPDGSRSSKGGAAKNKPAKGKTPKKSKSKAALASDPPMVADRSGADPVSADAWVEDTVVADLELTDLDLPETVPDLGDDAVIALGDVADGRGDPAFDDPELDGVATPPPKPSSTRRQWARSNIALLCAGAVIVALSVTLALVLSALGNQDALGSSRTTALAAARTDSVQIASYNYRDLGRDFGVVVANSTPSFRRKFTESSDALKSTLTEYKATAEASVVSAGLISASTSRAVALVLLDQKIANSKQASPTTDRSQIEITLVNSDGRWLIDQVVLL